MYIYSTFAHESQTSRSDSVDFVPLEPMLCIPRILESRFIFARQQILRADAWNASYTVWARPPPSVPVGALLYDEKGVRNGYSSTRVSLWESLMFGRLAMGPLQGLGQGRGASHGGTAARRSIPPKKTLALSGCFAASHRAQEMRGAQRIGT